VANIRALGIRAPGGDYKMATYPVASGQTFVAGDFVTLNSSGQLIALATVANTSVAAGTAVFKTQTGSTTAGFTGNMILGQALSPALDSTLSTLNASVPVALALEDVEFLLPGFSASLTSSTSAATFIGQNYGGIVTSGGFPAVNLDYTVGSSNANQTPNTSYPVATIGNYLAYIYTNGGTAAVGNNIFFRVTDLSPQDYTAWPNSASNPFANYGYVYASVIASASLATAAR